MEEALQDSRLLRPAQPGALGPGFRTALQPPAQARVFFGLVWENKTTPKPPHPRVTGLWGYGVMGRLGGYGGVWGYGVMGLWGGYGVMGLWGWFRLGGSSELFGGLKKTP